VFSAYASAPSERRGEWVDMRMLLYVKLRVARRWGTGGYRGLQVV